MKAPVKFGLYYFATGSGIMLLQYLFARDSLFNTTMGLLTGIGLAIVFIVLAIKADRADEPGYTMAEGIKAGMITFAIGSLLSAVFTYILYNYIDPSLVDQAMAAAQEMSAKMGESIAGIAGMDEATKAEMLEEMKKQNEEMQNPFTPSILGLSWVVGLIFPGIIVALIASAILKKN